MVEVASDYVLTFDDECLLCYLLRLCYDLRYSNTHVLFNVEFQY